MVLLKLKPWEAMQTASVLLCLYLWLRMGRKSVIPRAAEHSVLCSTPKRVTVSAQAWLVWMLTS